MKKPTFKSAYFSFAAFLALVVIILLLSVYGILSKFEKSQAKYMIDDYVVLMQEALNASDTAALSALSPDTEAPRFATKEALFAHLIQTCDGATLSHEASPLSFDANNPIYNIVCNGKTVANIQLSLVSETVKLGFLSIPEWKLTSLMPAADTLGSSYTFSIPDSFSATANGIQLTESDIIASENGFHTYLIEGFIEDASFDIKDAYGNSVVVGTPSLLTNTNQNKRIFSVPVTYECFDFTVPSDFSVTLNNGTLGVTTEDHYSTYTIYTASSVDSEFLTGHLQATDSIGNTLSFSDVNGTLLPVYDEYTITVPDCYRVFADETQLSLDSAILESLTDPQYVTESIQLATYCIGLAKTAEFKVVDSQDLPVSYELAKNTLTVPLLDCTVSIPENFTLQINGQTPECTPVLKGNPEYQYILEYADVPQLAEYSFHGLAKAPDFTVTDNLGNTTTYPMVNDDLAITAQIGLADFPDTLVGAPDPLFMAKKWSLFMTNDLEGNLNGYYNIRPYLIRNSYYDKVAYQWATNIDITFISDHIILDPGFTEESVTNVVVYSDTCFSCDIFFIKHMKLTRTGQYKDDTFYHQMFFVYVDDTDDGTDNPHWAIADMHEIN